MSVAGIVLAAGFSRRLGYPKQVVIIAGETLLARAVRVARSAGLGPIFVVVQPDTVVSRVAGTLNVVLVPNLEAEEGLASSIRAGVRELQKQEQSTGAVLMTCDQILLKPEHLRALHAQPDRVTGSGYSGKIAVPAYFPQVHFEDLMALSGDTGARDYLRIAHAVRAEELALDLDTEEDVARARALLEGNAN